MMKNNNKILIFDTTLRDGEQSPGASMNTAEKIQIAQQLEKLNVDIIEAGFAAASPDDFNAIDKIAQIIINSKVCSLARAIDSDIKAAGDAISKAKMNRIHTFIATSPIHMKYKLKMTPSEVIKKAVDAVTYAKTFVEDVEFSLEDACRSDMGFMKEITSAVIEVGASTINLPDTVGYLLPDEIYERIKEMVDFIDNKAIVSLHNHNDLGLGVANTLAGIKAGAKQVECTINGLGERAGNAAMEEIVMTLKTRNDIFSKYDTNINTKEIYPASRLVATITGIEPQPNKAIVGKNAFAHESGIHQDGVLKCQETYEIMKPENIGIKQNDSIILGKHSGRAAFKDKLIKLGFDDIMDKELNMAFDRFKILCDKKKEILDDDIRMIVTDEKLNVEKIYDIVSLQLSDFSDGIPSAVVTIKYNGKLITDAGVGNGTADAIFKTIDRITNYDGHLLAYQVNSVTKGKDALAKVICKVSFENHEAMIGHGLNIDTMLASARAYVSALNSYLSLK
ncbi:2-isopropylmalate synthase [hydrothermal vent metagenome]|uniref:2-isopropylmalate synthase n=1 Tax=hydrothermal vent metagenome TaxID=652676 RepID=A0A3B1DTA0_9ZZZZ